MYVYQLQVITHIFCLTFNRTILNNDFSPAWPQEPVLLFAVCLRTCAMRGLFAGTSGCGALVYGIYLA